MMNLYLRVYLPIAYVNPPYLQFLFANCAADHGSGPTWNQSLEAHSLSTQQQMGTR